ncbi:MAG: hypothetical protein ACUVSX_02285 [Aggregatilineales bacterium]
MAAPGSSALKVDSNVPFDAMIHDWLTFHERAIDHIAKPSRRYERSYLAWETVRLRKNPFFENGTGFEGYFVGRCRTPEEALERILGVSRAVLDNIARQHRRHYNFQSRLMKALAENRSDPQAVYVWAAELGAALARLRAQVPQNQEASAFHTDTYRLVNMLPPIGYHQNDSEIRQVYVVTGRSRASRALVTLQDLPPREQQAWLVALRLGRFGHPLVREFLRHNPM